MIAFGCSITVPEIYERYAKPGVRLAAEPDSEVFALASAGSIFRSHNLILEEAAACEDLEALVLVHQDAEIIDPDFCRKLRRALSDPDVGVVGSVGATGVRSIAWWEGSVSWASSVYRYGDFGGGELPAFPWNGGELPRAHTGEVDAVDGFVLGLSPWAVRNVRFDESLTLPHGYDFDFCLQVRAAGRKVVTEDLRVAHHHALKLVSNPEPWIEAHVRIAEKWDESLADVDAGEGEWKQRARRAEAEAAAAWLLAASKTLQADARARQHESRLMEMTDSRSWRITAPLRRLNAMRRAVRRRPRRREPVAPLPSRSPAVHEGAQGAATGQGRPR